MKAGDTLFVKIDDASFINPVSNKQKKRLKN